MAQTLTLVPIHSLIYTTTNSSSEMFVCLPDKPGEEVRQILNEIAQEVESPLENWVSKIAIVNDWDELKKEMDPYASYFYETWNEGELPDAIKILTRWGIPVEFKKEDSLERPLTRDQHDSNMETDSNGYVKNWKAYYDYSLRWGGDLFKWLNETQPFPGPIMVIHDQGDNSVPWEACEQITEKLNGYRMHLG